MVGFHHIFIKNYTNAVIDIQGVLQNMSDERRFENRL